MAAAREDSQWNHTSTIVATLMNVNRAKGKPAIKPEDIHPNGNGGKSGSKGVPLRKDNIEILKAFAHNV